MDEKKRRQFYARAGIADPIPPISVRRAWEYIDDSLPPEGEPDGHFRTHTEWVNKATSWIGWTGAKCFDALGRPCRNGGDMARARDEGAFPVSWYFPDRFPKPRIPTKGLFNAIRELRKGEPLTLNELRTAPSAKRVTWEDVESQLGEGSLIEEGERRRLSPQGAEGAALLVMRATRSANVS